MAIANTSVFGGFASSTVVGVSKLTTELSSLQIMNLNQSNINGNVLGGFNTPGMLGTTRLSTFIKTAEDPVTGGGVSTQDWYMS